MIGTVGDNTDVNDNNDASSIAFSEDSDNAVVRDGEDDINSEKDQKKKNHK